VVNVRRLADGAGWLVRENTNGQTLVAWHPAPAMTNAVVLTNEQLAGFSRVETLLADTAMHK
jgi:hypothetical protein